MERVTGIGGVFFRARDPEALRRWYAEHLGIVSPSGSPDGAPWWQGSGPTVWAPFPASTDYFRSPDQAWMINFRVRDLDAIVAQLRAGGIAVERAPEVAPNGRFARLVDPEGNPIELWEPKPQHGTVKVWMAFAATVLTFAVLLFGGAGTLDWPAAWAFLIVFFSGNALITEMLARQDPALLEERMKPIVQEGQPVWDRVIVIALAVVFVGWLILMGLDVVRFGWSASPIWLQMLGTLGVVAALWVMYQTFEENTFLAPVVKLQAERGQKVISSGPYRVVRHPMYAAALLLFPSIAFMLGSRFGVVAAALLAIGLIVRTALEDRELQRDLDGYREYAERVRYRLVPHLW